MPPKGGKKPAAEGVLSVKELIRYDWDGTWFHGRVIAKNKKKGWYTVLFEDATKEIVQLTPGALGSKWFRLSASEVRTLPG
jgi:hypothetical protein